MAGRPRVTGPGAVGPLRVAWAPMAAVAVVLVAVAPRYGAHWDELYFRMLPLRWWYEDQPPLTVWLTWLAARVSDELWVQRLPAVAAAVAGAYVAALFPRALGADAGVQRLAAWAHAFTVYPLMMGHIFTTSAIDLLAWQVVILLVLKATMGHRRHLVWASVVAGLACWNKLLIVVLLLALFVSVAVTDRWLIRTRETWVGAGIFAVLAAPQLLAQLANGMPMAQVSAGLVDHHGTTVRLVLLPALALFAGPPLIRVWLAGLAEPWRQTGRPGRFLLPTVVLLIVWTLASPSQPYYPMAAVLAALSMGWASGSLQDAWSRTKQRGIVAANSIVAILLCLPVLPAGEPWLSALSRVNPTVRDQLGWADYAAQLSAERRDGEAVITGHYVLAGALHHHGTEADRQAVHSGHNALWPMGPPESDRVLLVGPHATSRAGLFQECEPAGVLDTRRVAHPQLDEVPLLRCERPVAGWDELWPEFRRLSG